MSLEFSKSVLHVLHVDRHELGHEGLQVIDGLVPLVESVLVECCNLTQLSLQFSVTVLGQLLLKTNEDNLQNMNK